MTTPPHLLTIVGDGDGGLTYRPACPWPDTDVTSDRPCRMYAEGEWPDAAACRCDDDGCSCRLGYHWDCATLGGSIEGVGDECRAVPVPGCALLEAMANVGEEAFDTDDLRLAVPVTATFRGWDEPIRLRLASPVVSEVLLAVSDGVPRTLDAVHREPDGTLRLYLRPLPLVGLAAALADEDPT